MNPRVGKPWCSLCSKLLDAPVSILPGMMHGLRRPLLGTSGAKSGLMQSDHFPEESFSTVSFVGAIRAEPAGFEPDSVFLGVSSECTSLRISEETGVRAVVGVLKTDVFETTVSTVERPAPRKPTRHQQRQTDHSCMWTPRGIRTGAHPRTDSSRDPPRHACGKTRWPAGNNGCLLRIWNRIARGVQLLNRRARDV